MKVLVIGWDGATFDIINPLLENGKLKTISKMMNCGAYGKLKTVFGRLWIKKIIPLKNIQSVTAWTSFATGVKPNKHGIYDFVDRNGHIKTSNDIRVKTIWEILSKVGYKVGVVNVPMTYPPRPINGFIITGFMTPKNSDFTYPKELQEKLKNYIINFPVEKYQKQYPNIDYDEFIKDAYEIEGKRAKVVYRLIKKKWNFFMINFNVLDELQHFFWHFMDKTHPQYNPTLAKKYGETIPKFYEYLDKITERLIKRIRANIFLISDHGFGSKFKGYDAITILRKITKIFFGIEKRNPHITGSHKADGILIANGPNIRDIGEVKDIEIIDLAPTILKIFRLPIPNEMDGRVIKEIIV